MSTSGRSALNDLKSKALSGSPRWARRLYARVRGRDIPLRSLDFGDFADNSVFDSRDHWGFYRGGPLDRVYIESFLQDHADAIRGTVLEIGEDLYTKMYGSATVTSEILHIDDSIPNATYVGDLAARPSVLPPEHFDCIIFTQTLHLIFDFRSALLNLWDALKPGGSLLITTPGITHQDFGEWGSTWCYAFTPYAMRRMCTEFFEVEASDARGFGNPLVAASFLYGVGRGEISLEVLSQNDERFAIVVACHVTKPDSDRPEKR